MYLRSIYASILLIAFVVLVSWFTSTANAGYWTAYDDDYDYDYFRSDRLSREHRDAGDVDDWLERGNSTITESKRFPDGIRLTAWASDYQSDEEFDFAIASAIYLFEVPRRAQYIEIKVRYKGEGRESEFDDFEESAGRVWVRNLEKERRQHRYDEDEQETLYGDTFLLRAKRRSETIKIPAANHVNRDGFMEVHIVAESDQLIDVEYVDVSSYRRQPRIRVIQRHVPTYRYSWRPWYRYTYLHFYDGPCYYNTDYGYYVRWNYPVFSQDYVVVRANYNRYLGSYYRRYPRIERHYNIDKNVNVHVYKNEPGKARTRRLNAWTQQHEKVRKVYDRSRLTKKKSRGTGIQQVRADVRTTIQKARTAPVLSDRVIKTRDERIKRRRGNISSTPRETPRSSIMRHSRGTSQPERSIRVTPSQQEETKRDIRSKSRSSSTESKSSRNGILDAIRKRRSSSSSTKASSSSVKRSQPKKQEAPKKKDDDDEDEDEEEEKKKEENRRTRTKRRR